MMSFAYRDRRLALVGKALDNLAQHPTSLPQNILHMYLNALQKEQTQLTNDRYEVSDGFCAAIAASWVWDHASSLLGSATADFALSALFQKPVMTPAMATAAQNLPRIGVPNAAFFDKVVQTIGADAGVELAGIALGAWLGVQEGGRVNPVRDIAVMLPLRLETLFKEQPGGTWRLLLRVIPDEPSILRDEPVVSQEEANYLSAFWQRSASITITAGMQPVDWLMNDSGILAWAALSDRIGAPRAAWMVAEFPPLLVNGRFVCVVPPGRIGQHPDARVAGLPPKLNVSAFNLDGAQFEIGSLSPVDGIKIVMPTDPDAHGNWLTDWKAALEVGLGAEFVLPADIGPDTISALYVYGVGDEEPADHFAAHANAGVMGLLELGAPTNSIEGADGADLGKDQDAWRTIALNRLRGERGNGVAAVADALCGGDGALPDLPGGAVTTSDSRLLAQALWPALWGHYCRDVWGAGDDAHALWSWANDYLAPEGPLPPLRFDSQPYGLLPVVSIDNWERGGNDPVDHAEERVVGALRQLLPQWTTEAEKLGTIAGAGESGLLDLLGRTGVSSNYDYRTFAPAGLLAKLYPAIAPSAFLDAALSQWQPATDIVLAKPVKIYSAIWGAEPLELPLIGAQPISPKDIEDLFNQLYEIRSERFADTFYGTENKRALITDNLLVRLMIWSAVVAKAWYIQSVPTTPPVAPAPLLNPNTWVDPVQMTPVEQLQTNFDSAFTSGRGTPPTDELVNRHRKTIMALASRLADPQKAAGVSAIQVERRAELERALRATLDTASHRLDPWATGVAWHLCQQQAASGRAHRRLGAYGWLDGPFLGKPGPNESGRLHAPSYDQALTSIILRDKYLSSQNELTADGRNIWRTELDSAGVRTALAITEEIRMGFHVYEVVGRRVEEIVGGRDQIANLRTARPLRPERPDPRDVCNGFDALAALLGSGLAGVLSNDAAARADQMQRLNALQAGIDAFADLLLAEGIYNVVGGHPKRAADAMDAAAGFARPPEFGVVKTPPSGYRLTTSIVAAMPYRTPVAEGTALELADSSLATFIDARFGKPHQWIFRAKWKEGDIDRAGQVDLAALGLKPLEAVLIPHDFLAEVVRRRLGQPLAEVDQADGHRLMRQVAGTFGVQPAMAGDISAVPDKTADAPIDQTIHAELLSRYAGVYKVVVDFIGPGETDVSKIAFLRKALTWGILSSAEIAVRRSLIDMVFESKAPAAGALATLVAGAQATLSARLNAAPVPTDSKTIAMSAADLARAIGDLVAPGGKLAITARWPVPTFRGRTSLRETMEPALDIDWLPVVAAVRPALARFEAVQLEASMLGAFDPFAAWSSAPAGDPWRVGLVDSNKAARLSDLVTLDMSRLVNAYGANEAFDGTDVAVALIDQFSEAVPMAKRTTYAAFGFNAPASRAPQAILLAVPPRADLRIGNEDMLQILVETRRLAHARATRSGDGPGNPLAPSMWFQATGPLRVRLDTGTQYTR